MSRFAAYASEALEALWRNRVRSLLTMLGMVIGTASVIAVLGIGRAASDGIAASLRAFGDPGIAVQVDPKQDDPLAAQIRFRDAAVVAELAAGQVARVYPVYQRQYRLRANGTKYDATVVSASEHHIDTLTLREGRRIGREDVIRAAHVCLISQPLEQHLFGHRPALGADIRLNGSRFRVVGVYDEWRSGIFNTFGNSDYAEIPYTTFHELAPGPVDGLQIFPVRGADFDDVTRAVEGALRHVRGRQAQYVVQDALSFVSSFERVIAVSTIGVTVIGAVALLVAGIGIMNIMLVSVAERTHEIGIRRAIGASRRDVALQFLIEAVLLSLLGGAVGTALGIAIALAAAGAVARLTGPAPVPFGLIIAVAVGFSAGLGVAFGTYPALRAGRLDPIEALHSP